ncbi:hypothetical protein ACS0TY_030063 [Phlomoides rotata]
MEEQLIGEPMEIAQGSGDCISVTIRLRPLRKQSQKPGIWSNISTTKDFMELSSFLCAPDPLLSPFLCTTPFTVGKDGQKDQNSCAAATRDAGRCLHRQRISTTKDFRELSLFLCAPNPLLSLFRCTAPLTVGKDGQKDQNSCAAATRDAGRQRISTTKDFRELSSFLCAPDPPLSPFLCTTPLTVGKDGQKDQNSCVAATRDAGRCSKPSCVDEAEGRDHKEMRQRAAFVQELLYSTIF